MIPADVVQDGASAIEGKIEMAAPSIPMDSLAPRITLGADLVAGEEIERARS
jgi:hypothetical protein